MFCLLAVEKETAETIKLNLERSGLYPDWKFIICNDASELLIHSRNNIDVLIVSRFLPGEKPLGLLEKLYIMFPNSHIILLAGTKSEQQRIYIQTAEKLGLTNIVTGALPGDRPYTIFAALNEVKTSFEDEALFESFNEEPENTVEKDIEEEPSLTLENNFGQDNGQIEEKVEEKLESDISDTLENILKLGDDKEEVVNKLTEIVNMLKTENGIDKNINNNDDANKLVRNTDKGILVLVSANKGGVGKTTVSITLAVALAQAGIPTVIIDYDLGAPNIAPFLGIKNVPGIEKLAGQPITKNTLSDLIVKKGQLDVLPGPMNNTMPSITKEQLLEVTKVLTTMYPVVICDTPAEYWTRPWLFDVFANTDYVISVVDQSVFSEHETKAYAPYLLTMGVRPEQIGIVLNRFSPKLHNPRTVEKIFCSGFKKGVKKLPKVVAVIPENWTEHVKQGYKGAVVGLDDVYSQWHKLASNIAQMAGYEYKTTKKKRKKGNLKDFLTLLRKKSSTFK